MNKNFCKLQPVFDNVNKKFSEVRTYPEFGCGLEPNVGERGSGYHTFHMYQVGKVSE
jgi:hypothetical protein